MGIGFRLFEKAITLSQRRRVAIDSVQDMVETYEKRGFLKEFNLYLMSGTLALLPESKSTVPGVSICPVTKDNISELCLYDKSVSGIDRELFVRKVFLKSTTLATCAISNQGSVVGFLAVHKVDIKRVHIFSFYADDLNIAKLLLRDAAAQYSAPVSVVGLYVPEMNLESEKVFAMYGLQRDPDDTKVIRMTNKSSFEDVVWTKVFCVCCFGFSFA